MALVVLGTGFLLSCSSDATDSSLSAPPTIAASKSTPLSSTPLSSNPSPNTTTEAGPTDDVGGAAFSDRFDTDLARWTISRWRQEGSSDPGYVGPAETVCGVDDALPPLDVAVCDGHLEISNASQNYGDLFLRADQQFDIAGRTGTISFDMTTTGTLLEGYPVLLFTDGPYSAPSYDADNASGPGPENGLLIQFDAQCAIDGTWALAPQVRSWSDHVMSTHVGAGCAKSSASGTVLDRVEVRVSTSAIDISVNGAPWFSADVGAPGRSYVHIGVHNHATEKYASRPAWTSWFDNVVFDGPVLPVHVAEVADPLTPDGDGINIAYMLPTAELPLPDVAADPAAAWLVLSMQANRGSDFEESRLNYRLNGGSWHEVAVQDADARPTGSSTYSWRIPVDVSELVEGDNTVEFTVTGFEGGWPAAVANIDLVIEPAR